jgi:hypothetical protein
MKENCVVVKLDFTRHFLPAFFIGLHTGKKYSEIIATPVKSAFGELQMFLHAPWKCVQPFIA